jgi:mRNA interferase MazF
VIERGALHWVQLGPIRGSAPARHRPVLVVQSDPFNASRLNTVLVAVVSSNTQLAEHPGNVFLPAAASGLPKDSAVNVTQLVTLDKDDLGELVETLPRYLLSEVDAGLRKVLAL